MKCAHCGNENKKYLWDEGDTLYCSLCTYRTWASTGKEAGVRCPYCHRIRDPKAAYCRHCNDTTWARSTRAEFKETNELLNSLGDYL